MADKYIEWEFVLIAIDLVLHRVQAYRHLLFNMKPFSTHSFHVRRLCMCVQTRQRFDLCTAGRARFPVPVRVQPNTRVLTVLAECCVQTDLYVRVLSNRVATRRAFLCGV